MSELITRMRNFILRIELLIVGTWLGVFIFDRLVATPSPLPIIGFRAIEAGLVILATTATGIEIRNFKSTLSKHVGPHAASTLSFVMVVTSVVIGFFAVLHVFQIAADSLLVGGGVVAVVVGIFVSTLFGNVASGALILAAFPFRVGESVMINSIPGRIEEITGMYTRIRNTSGSETVIPNSAIIQGSVVVTKMRTKSAHPSELPYAVGDRIYTSYIGGEGRVTEITPFHTKVVLDSGREATIPNNSVVTGTVQVGKLSDSRGKLEFTLRLDWDPEEATAAMNEMARSNGQIFLSPITVLYSELNGPLVELIVACDVTEEKRGEAKSRLLKAAYLAKNHSSAAR